MTEQTKAEWEVGTNPVTNSGLSFKKPFVAQRLLENGCVELMCGPSGRPRKFGSEAAVLAAIKESDK